VPAAPVFDPRRTHAHPQLAARGFYETPEHPEVGRVETPGVPFRYAGVERWLRRAAPTVGQHSREILAELCGCSQAELDALEADQVIGTRPEGT
jgi:crotonobetainyl-CoA:carnitine CoA-transferase CaiB-like acyl-CoA transferase